MTAKKKVEAQLSNRQMLQGKGGRVMTVPIHTDEDALDELLQVKAELVKEYQAAAKIFRNPDAKVVADAAIQVLVAREQRLAELVRETTVRVRFRGIGRHNFRQLLDQHPPREEDHEFTRKSMSKEGDETVKAAWNDQTFPSALIIASCFDPKLNEGCDKNCPHLSCSASDELQVMTEDWNDEEFNRLFAAAHHVNTAARVVDLGEA